MHARPRQRGVSLIEVLMAVLVFSVGLLGVAGLMVMAVRSNHSAFLHTQAVFLADSMADRMSANPVGVWSGDYNATTWDFSASASASAPCSHGCTPRALAEADLRAWQRQLTSLLPNHEDTGGTIRCDNGQAGFTPVPWAPPSAAMPPVRGQLAMRPPYGGKCDLHVRWRERDGTIRYVSRTFQP